MSSQRSGRVGLAAPTRWAPDVAQDGRPPSLCAAFTLLCLITARCGAARWWGHLLGLGTPRAENPPDLCPPFSDCYPRVVAACGATIR